MARSSEAVRFALYATPLLAIAGVGMLVLRHFGEKDRTIAEQKRIIAELERRLDRAWADELVADLRVDGVDTDSDPPRMRLTFVQYKPGTEEPAFRREMELLGEEVYVDALVVQFERKFVDAGDGLRGKSLLLFRRAFGDQQRPVDGVPLWRAEGDVPIPEAVQVDAQPSEFERKLWARFWELANDPKQAAAEGVRVAQGEAPHVKVVPGQVYELRLRASGGLMIKPRLPAAVVGEAGGARDAGVSPPPPPRSPPPPSPDR